MRIAFFGDIHGNMAALEAVLEHLQKEEFDHVICLGDLTNPLKSSVDVVRLIHHQKIPCIRGNHEDYVINFFERDGGQFTGKEHFRPVELSALCFGESDLEIIKDFDFDGVIRGPQGQDVYFCHASPLANNLSFLQEMGSPMTKAIHEVQAKVIVAGHMHRSTEQLFEGKQLVTVGSVGLAATGNPRAQFGVLEFFKNSWHVRHCEIKYDHERTVREYLDSGFIEDGGPMAWLLFDELWSAQSRLSPFFRFLKKDNLTIESVELSHEVRRYLMALNRWDLISEKLNLVF